MRREKLTKPQTTMVISLWLSVCSHVLNFIVIDHYKATFLKFFRCSRFSKFDSKRSKIS